MFRSDILSALYRTHVVLLNTDIAGVIALADSGELEGARSAAFPAFREALLYRVNADPADQLVIEAMRLDWIFDEKTWESLTAQPNSENASRRKDIATRLSHLDFALSAAVSLFEDGVPESARDGNVNPDSTSTLRLVLDSTPDNPTEARAVIDMLQGLEDIYSAVTRLVDREAPPLALVYCDSGGSESFSFKGLGEAIDALRRTVNNIFGFRAQRGKEAVELVAQTLPELKKIEAARREGSIDDATADELTSALMRGVRRLGNSNARTVEKPPMVTVRAEIAEPRKPKQLRSGEDG